MVLKNEMDMSIAEDFGLPRLYRHVVVMVILLVSCGMVQGQLSDRVETSANSMEADLLSITLPEAVRMALTNNLDIAILEEGILSSAAGVTQELGAFDAEVSAEYLTGENTRPRDPVRVSAGLSGIVALTAFAVIFIILFVSARDLLDGRMTAGELTAFAFLALLVASGIATVTHVWAELSRASGAADRIAELLAVKPAIETPSDPVALPAPSQGLLEFRDVNFCYPERPGVTVLKDFNLEVRPGETVAIVGPSGAGKSSVLKLILRFYDPNDGEVRIDGVNIRDLDLTALRSVVSLIPQDPEVFSGTALENIRFGLSSATDEQVRAAAGAAAAAGFIEEMPDGYESLLGPSGRLLSGGQRQRLAIARAILRDASILLFDEATSSLDSESEALIQQSLAAMAGQRTVIIIAHRLATVRHADRMVVMDDGRIVAVGTHDELLKQGGLYTRYARSQFVDAPG
jgi:ATP-binding cassette subfamily B protein